MKRFMFLSLVASVASVASVALFGCGKVEDDSSKMIAKVGNEKVTEQRFSDYLKFKRVPEQDEKKVQSLLDDYLEREALSQQALDSTYIDKRLADIEVDEFRKQMLISRYFESFLKDVVSEEAIQNYYNSNPEQFQTERVRVAHVLIRTNRSMSEAERQALLTKALEAHSKITSNMTFEEAVAAYSDDNISAKNGGDLGWIRKGAIDPVFSDKVFGMKIGEVSEPFVTSFGYHIVKVLEGPQTVKTPFEKVKGDIRYQLRQQAKQAEMDRMLGQLKIEKVN